MTAAALGLYVHIPFCEAKCTYCHFALRGRLGADTYGACCRAVEERGPSAAVAGDRVISARERVQEALFTGMRRREGVDLDGFRANV